MAGYVIIDSEVTDEAVFAEFFERVPATGPSGRSAWSIIPPPLTQASCLPVPQHILKRLHPAFL